jgi:hypothetical protein
VLWSTDGIRETGLGLCSGLPTYWKTFRLTAKVTYETQAEADELCVFERAAQYRCFAKDVQPPPNHERVYAPKKW